MTKTRISFPCIIVIFFSGLLGSAQSTADQKLVLEAVKYRLKPGAVETFPENRRAGLTKIASYPGFVRAWTYQSIEEPELIFDYVLWESLEEARSAGGLVVQAPEAAGMMGAIDSILFASHLEATESSVALRPPVRSSRQQVSLTTLSVADGNKQASGLRCEATPRSRLYVSLEEGFRDSAALDYLYIYLQDDNTASARAGCALPLANRNTQVYRQYGNVISQH